MMPSLAKALASFCFLLSLSLLAGEPLPIQMDVVYGKADGVDLKLDLALPPSGDGPFPMVVCIHGGGWRAGNKASFHGAIRNFAKSGYVAATVEYRFAPKYKFPAQVEDVKCAVRYLRSRAKELKADPARVAAMGDSAGGHLSLMLGLMDPADGLDEGGGSVGQSSKVQAVINYYGPTDFTAQGVWSPLVLTMVGDFLGTTDQQNSVVSKASPISYINKGDPPILTLQGTADPLVPAAQATTLHELLKKAGVPEKLVIIENGGHGFKGEELARTLKATSEFLNEHLKGKAAAN